MAKLRQHSPEVILQSNPAMTTVGTDIKTPAHNEWSSYLANLQQPPPWSCREELIIREPYDYVAGLPSKDFRGRMIEALQSWLKLPDQSLQAISKAIATLHNASLLIDDIEDGSELRRGLPSTHTIFGIAQTINSGNYMYFKAMLELQSLENPSLTPIFLDEMLNLHRGQGLDLYWRDSYICPTEEEYLEMVRNKTGGLFRLLFRLMLEETSVPSARDSAEKFLVLLDTLSMIFQILDDYKNLQSQSYIAAKGFAEDLTEGKFSFPVICAVRADQSSRVVQNVLKQRTVNEAVKKATIQTMERLGSFERTRTVLQVLRHSALISFDEFMKTEDQRKCCQSLRSMLDKLSAGI